MNKAIKYRLYPNNNQIHAIESTFGCCRKVWNLMLSDKIDYYRENKANLLTTPAMYKEEYSFLKEVDSSALCNVQLNLQTAYKNFFRNKKFGFPKFKSKKKSRKSYTTNLVHGNIVLFEEGIKLPKLGFVKAEVHHLPEKDWKLKSATISKASDGKYYASALFEYEEDITPVSKETDKAIGLDYKSDGLYVDSNGKCCDMPHFYRKAEKRLAKEQRKLARKIGNKKERNQVQ